MKKALKVILAIIVISAVFCMLLDRDGEDSDKSDICDTFSEESTGTENSVADEMPSDTVTEESTDICTDFGSIPEYSGNPYYILNDNIPCFSDADKSRTDAFEYYSPLDSLNRCGQAYANLCRQLRPDSERGEIGQIKPSGWHTVKYNGLIDGNYLYNRCHLIAYQLAGENANEKNLITGTRYLNTCGMQYFETLVGNYIDRTQNHVLYRVTPVYEGDNLVASGVQMEGWSVEDGGRGICYNVYCYNVQPGIIIDYASGESCLGETESLTGEVQTAPVTTSDGEQETYEFIINTNTGKFHLDSCDSVADMAVHNKMPYTGTVQEVIDMGYKPCGKCLPGY